MREHPFVGAPLEDIARRVRDAASAAAGGAVVVEVGDEGFGYRNVGVTLPRARRTKLDSRNLRMRVARAIEAVGVAMWPAAIAPAVRGDLVGSVRVRELDASRFIDASSFAAAPPKPARLA
jgi:hypothetical protein